MMEAEVHHGLMHCNGVGESWVSGETQPDEGM